MNLFRDSFEIEGQTYAVKRQIGEGAFGFVYEVKTSSWGAVKRKYALKKLICQLPEQIEEARKELRLMREISHANVMPIVATSAKNKKDGRVEILFLMPLFQTSLQSLIDHGPGYPSSAFCGKSQLFFDVCIGFCKGLLAIHEYNYRHCDFKPANVLINFDCTEFSKKIPDASLSAIVVTDLGSACTPLVHEIKNRSDALTVQDYAASMSTATFRAPELFDPPSLSVIDGRADVWAVGCSMYAMLYSRNPFENPTEGFSSLAVTSGNYRIPNAEVLSGMSDIRASQSLEKLMEVNAVSIMSLCLTAHTESRPQLKDIITALENAKSGKHIQMLNTDTSLFDTKLTTATTSTGSRPNKSTVKTTNSSGSSTAKVEFENPPPLPLPSGTTSTSRAPITNSSTSAPGMYSPLGRRSLSMRQSTDSIDEFGDFEGASDLPANEKEISNKNGADASKNPIYFVDALFSSDDMCKMTDSQLSGGAKVIFEGEVTVRCRNLESGDEICTKSVRCSLFPMGLWIREASDESSNTYCAVDFNKYCLHKNCRLQAQRLSSASSQTEPLRAFAVSVHSMNTSMSDDVIVLQFGCESAPDADAWVARLNVVFKSILI